MLVRKVAIDRRRADADLARHFAQPQVVLNGIGRTRLEKTQPGLDQRIAQIAVVVGPQVMPRSGRSFYVDAVIIWRQDVFAVNIIRLPPCSSRAAGAIQEPHDMPSPIESAIRKAVTTGVMKLADFNRWRMADRAAPTPSSPA